MLQWQTFPPRPMQQQKDGAHMCTLVITTSKVGQISYIQISTYTSYAVASVCDVRTYIVTVVVVS